MDLSTASRESQKEENERALEAEAYTLLLFQGGQPNLAATLRRWRLRVCEEVSQCLSISCKNVLTIGLGIAIH